MELDHATFGPVSPNEAGLDQKQDGETGQPTLDDPVGLRIGAWANPFGRLKFYIGKISGDVLRWKDRKIHRTEAFFIKFAVDEMVDGDGDPVPMLALFMARGIDGSEDADMQQVAVFSRKGVRFDVPVVGLPAGGGAVTRFSTDTGKFCVNWQDDPIDHDGNPTTPIKPVPRGIVYDTNGTTDESKWTAVGRIKVDPL